jgi:septal ring factor EnvC (AmiA/AmiB activator)
MHRSFKPWMNTKGLSSAKSATQAALQTQETPVEFEFSKDIEALEAHQKMDMSDLEAYVRKAAEAPVLYVSQNQPAAPNPVAKYTNQSVISVHQQIDRVVEDNRLLAIQIQTLLAEKEKMEETIQQQEDELNRFYRVFGKFYIRH